MKKYLTKKNLLSLVIFGLLAVPVAVFAEELSLGLGAGEATGLGTQDIKLIITGIINVLLGFLGIIAVVIILLGGFKWMTAAGNEDKVGEAKKLIGAGIVGLVIILAAYAIATFVINQLVTATGGGAE